ncbi:MAG: AbrB/MazE/SpoVT family DNA-binding domain-containing protein [Methanosarcinales archaeon]|nr:MAG: AbrB/MazE/SpoVT family DNA-binding domain-containing protein [Methanosarcinales archaeon]
MISMEAKMHSGKLYIPKRFLKALNIQPDSEIEVELENDHIVIRPSVGVDKGAKRLLELLKNPPYGLAEDKEYSYEDID